MMTVAVTGPRDVSPGERAEGSFLVTLYELDVDVVRHGNCRGVDRWVAEMAPAYFFRPVAFPANWEVYGDAAGPIRNREMLKGVGALIAFVPGGRGTNDCIRSARKADVPVIEIDLKTGEVRR